MMAKAKKPIIFAVIALLLVFLYLTFFKKDGEEALLSSSLDNAGAVSLPDSSSASSFISQDFLALLLGIRNISLDDSILSDPAFLSLRDSSIELVQDGSEGRRNPFAPFGSDF
jgi:hypothetical protein